MDERQPLSLGVEADLEGQPCPPHIIRWLASLPSDALGILDRLARAGHGAWLVGGCVRDAWLQQAGDDIDMCTTATPDEVMLLFSQRAIATGIDFGTVTIKGDARHYEVTTCRTESLYRDGRRPDQVAWGTSLKEDLSRRDFTFNSMAVDVARARFYDPYNGVGDLNMQRVRAVGDANVRCEEDALRILRAYRFLDQSESALRTMDPALQGAVRNARDRLSMVAVERKWIEMQKMLAGPCAGAVLREMACDGVLSAVFEQCSIIDPAMFSLLDDERIHPVSLAEQLALLMSQHDGRALLNQLEALKVPKKLMKETLQVHERLAHLPGTTKPELRVFDHVLGDAAGSHLRIRCGFQRMNIAKVGGRILEGDALLVHDAWQSLPTRQSPERCLVDGHWLMERTALTEGMKLGRLKSWIHRLQIEEDVTVPSEMEQILARLPYVHGDYESWPRLEFP